MDREQNPYRSPEVQIDYRARRRRRQLIQLAQMAGLFLLLFPAYWALRFLTYLLNVWLLDSP